MNAHLPIKLCERMCDSAGITATAAEVQRLAEDVRDVRDELVQDVCFVGCPTFADAAGTLERRIGGLRNLRSYLDVLMVQQR
jgi:hypothetical protein